jgi:HD-GYP domain-containing protein (c-di-GMP phosphodiesterase class II)
VNNQAVLNARERLMEAISTLFELDPEINLQVYDDFIFVNNLRLKLQLEGYLSFHYIIEEFAARGIGRLTIIEGVEKEELTQFTLAFNELERSENAFTSLTKLLADEGVRHLDLGKFIPPAEGLRTTAGAKEIKKASKSAFFRAIQLVKSSASGAEEQKKLSLKKGKRLVQSLIDLVLEDEYFLIGLTSIKNYDDYTFNHSVNVCILSLALGSHLGLSRTELCNLGIGALFHDLGKLLLPKEVLFKPGKLTDEEWKLVKKHPIFGVKALIKNGLYGDFGFSSIIIAFEHHLRLDHSGYPELSPPRRPSLFGRIVSIADAYDAMTTSRCYQKALLPEEALKKLYDTSPKLYDRTLVKVFINMLGIYPPGSFILLNTGEKGVVYRPNPTKLDRPRVKLVFDAKEKPLPGHPVDLTEEVPRKGYKRSVDSSLDPYPYGVNVGKLLSE